MSDAKESVKAAYAWLGSVYYRLGCSEKGLCISGKRGGKL